MHLAETRSGWVLVDEVRKVAKIDIQKSKGVVEPFGRPRLLEWRDGAAAPELVVREDSQDETHFRVFPSRQDCKDAGFRYLGPFCDEA